MPKKLTVIGVLAALALGAFGLFNSSGQAAQIQPFSAATVNWTACYGGSAPDGGVFACGAGSSPNTAPANTNVVSYTLIDLPAGQRLTLPITFTPTTWSSVAVPCTAGANNDCTAGTVTGDVKARTDILCDAGSPDILSDTTLASPNPWPDSGWPGFDFTRTAQDAALGGGGAGAPTGGSANAYVPQIVPFPPSFTFRALDTAILTRLFLGGTIGLDIPPIPLQLAAYRSAGATYDVSVALLGGNPTPPTNDYLCLDTPQDSIAEVSYLQTPVSAGLYPRWTIFTGDIDERDSTVIDRIVDLGCVNVGGFAGTDGDNDCLPTPADTNDANPDQDGDGLPDGIEASIGFPVNAADSDGDGANDYTEMFQFTSPTTADSDGDGSADRPDNGADENAPTSPATIDDTTADDNCPNEPNPGQENNDSAPDFRLLPSAGNLDFTNNRQDVQGDVCDTDDDNDGIVDVAEGVVQIATAAPFCVASGTAPNGGPLSALDSDHDNDLGLDGRECQQNTRPDCSGTSGTFACASVAIARLGSGGASDPDNDQLFAPGVGTANATAETFYRTQNIRVATGNAEDNADPTNGDGHADNPDLDSPENTGETDNDSDNDGLLDGIEVRYYGTHPANPDTDADGCRDGREAADVDGNRSVGAGDLGAIANGTIPVFGNYRGADGQVDNNKKNYDLDRNGAVAAADLGIAAAAASFGSCGTPSNQQGPSINNQTRNP